MLNLIAFIMSARPGFMQGSSSKTSRPTRSIGFCFNCSIKPICLSLVVCWNLTCKSDFWSICSNI
ncbi:hypothetical protein Hanom_Chr02g00169021 [Helianthus anomalus]